MNDDIAELLQVGEAIPWSGSLTAEDIKQDIMNYLKTRKAMNSYPPNNAVAQGTLGSQLAAATQSAPEHTVTERIMQLAENILYDHERAYNALNRLTPSVTAEDYVAAPRPAERLPAIEHILCEVRYCMKALADRIGSL